MIEPRDPMENCFPPCDVCGIEAGACECPEYPKEAWMSDDTAVLRGQAIQAAHSLGIDKMARVIAKSGHGDEAGCNYRASADLNGCLLTVSATFGAGTNSTEINLAGVVVYYASDYGRHVVSFKNGGWVQYLGEWAERTAAGEVVNRLISAVRKDAEERERFTPMSW